MSEGKKGARKPHGCNGNEVSAECVAAAGRSRWRRRRRWREGERKWTSQTHLLVGGRGSQRRADGWLPRSGEASVAGGPILRRPGRRRQRQAAAARRARGDRLPGGEEGPQLRFECDFGRELDRRLVARATSGGRAGRGRGQVHRRALRIASGRHHDGSHALRQLGQPRLLHQVYPRDPLHCCCRNSARRYRPFSGRGRLLL
mmetsp:Transcript_138130/g.350027  ORF Transcript_138130/g.350027 Transcript_138130/m.350027 type:complete len:202 (+) Transcript_138130:150-755(+)